MPLTDVVTSSVIPDVQIMLGERSGAYTSGQLDIAENMVIRDIANITGLTTTDDFACFDNLKIDMILWRLSKLGSEGLNSFSAAGVSENYQQDYPEHILRQLRAKRRVRLL